MRRLPIALLAFLLPLSACGKDGSLEPGHTETYTLVEVNGSTLPALHSESGRERTHVLEGTLKLNSDGSYSEVIRVRATLAAGDSLLGINGESGRFTIKGSKVQLWPAYYADSRSYFATLNGDTLSYTAPKPQIIFDLGTISAKYKKQ